MTITFAQSPTCNDLRTVLAAKDCCQITTSSPHVDDFVWRQCTLTAEEECSEGDVLVRTGNNAVEPGGAVLPNGALWTCKPHMGSTRRLSDSVEGQLDDLLRRVLELEEKMRLYKR